MKKQHDASKEAKSASEQSRTTEKEPYEAPRLQRHEPLLDVTAAQSLSASPKDR